MAITWGERPNSAKISTDAATFSYVLTGVSDRIIAKTLAAGYSSALWGDLYRSSIDVEEAGPELFYCDVHYGTPDKKEPEAGEYKWTFDTTGATRHITQGIAHVATYPAPGKTPIDHQGAIGVTDNGVEGTDVPDRAFKWTETHFLLLASYGFAYATVLGAYTGQSNTTTFRGFPAGTVRFNGASGGQSSKDPTLLEVTFHFEVSPNESNLSIGEITDISKKGWEYLWVTYREEKDAISNTTRLVPMQVDIEQVHYAFPFTALMIGS